MDDWPHLSSFIGCFEIASRSRCLAQADVLASYYCYHLAAMAGCLRLLQVIFLGHPVFRRSSCSSLFRTMHEILRDHASPVWMSATAHPMNPCSDLVIDWTGVRSQSLPYRRESIIRPSMKRSSQEDRSIFTDSPFEIERKKGRLQTIQDVVSLVTRNTTLNHNVQRRPIGRQLIAVEGLRTSVRSVPYKTLLVSRSCLQSKLQTPTKPPLVRRLGILESQCAGCS
ncbi:hypothetical protein EJ03DRAFT_49375 [Teratosphaeria nubilosa]|uniref:Uncharacterized protein n=1 Tax=Teratosphaeria nubilosa TaxID=161662 RepID=A0A6G1KTG3_9PEZI|nr:hypothetical protein EJ03DRAFT_49375 [Teratosphaeria nubilosa]